MSVGNDGSGGFSAEGFEIMQKLLGAAENAEGADDAVAGTAKLAQLLFAKIALANIDPSALRMVLESERHPLFVRRFAALDANGNRQSWTRQEERVLKRYANAQARLFEARAVLEAAELNLREAQSDLDSVSIEVGLMRLSVMLRGLQEFVRPALEAGPLVTLMLAVLGDPAAGDAPASAEVRSSARRTLEVLARRIGDDAFRHKMGDLIRDFATAYDDEAGAEGRLGLVAAESLRQALLTDGSAMRSLREVAAGAAAETALDETATVANGETLSDGEEDDVISRLPF